MLHVPEVESLLREVQTATVAALRVSRSIVERYANQSPVGLKSSARKKLPYAERLHVDFMSGVHTALEGSGTVDERLLRRGLVGMSFGLAEMSRDNRLTLAQQLAALGCAERLISVSGAPPSLREKVKSRRKALGTASGQMESIGFRPSLLDELHEALRKSLHPTDVELLEGLPQPGDEGHASIATLLVEGASRDVADDAALSADLSQSGLKIVSLALSNFRGVVGDSTLALTDGTGKPVSVSIFGSNGTGKSSYVDGIELALQGRVGRSAKFDSTQFPWLRNLSADAPLQVSVTLSDDLVVQRRLVRSASGRTVAEGPPTGPGFRWAPLALKRSDIVRFLDTEALSRGTVLFDYFPNAAGEMGRRPDEELKDLEDERHRKRIERQALAVRLAAQLGVDASTLDSADKVAREVRERLLGGKDASAVLTDGTWDALPEETQATVVRLQDVHRRLAAIRKRVAQGPQVLNPKAYAAQAREMRRVVQLVADELTKSFLRITGATHIERIEVLAGETGPVSLDLVVVFANGEKAFPQQVFSEGYRDLLATLFFLAVSKVSVQRGQSRVLILDDVFQSVDSAIRLNVMRHVLSEFADWQLIVTLHDRLWLEQLRALFRARGHPTREYRLSGWSFTSGPQVAGDVITPVTAVENALTHGETASTCAAAGRLLEQICGEQSMRLRISIKRALDDKYTLGDLWPGLVKALKRSHVRDVVADINDVMEMRNLVGAHYNSWAESLDWEDARGFAEKVLELFRAMHCDACLAWVTTTVEARDTATCSCGALVVDLRGPA
jgi:hypothetical protein